MLCEKERVRDVLSMLLLCIYMTFDDGTKKTPATKIVHTPKEKPKNIFKHFTQSHISAALLHLDLIMQSVLFTGYFATHTFPHMKNV